MIHSTNSHKEIIHAIPGTDGKYGASIMGDLYYMRKDGKWEKIQQDDNMYAFQMFDEETHTPTDTRSLLKETWVYAAFFGWDNDIDILPPSNFKDSIGHRDELCSTALFNMVNKYAKPVSEMHKANVRCHLAAEELNTVDKLLADLDERKTELERRIEIIHNELEELKEKDTTENIKDTIAAARVAKCIEVIKEQLNVAAVYNSPYHRKLMEDAIKVLDDSPFKIRFDDLLDSVHIPGFPEYRINKDGTVYKIPFLDDPFPVKTNEITREDYVELRRVRSGITHKMCYPLDQLMIISYRGDDLPAEIGIDFEVYHMDNDFHNHNLENLAIQKDLDSLQLTMRKDSYAVNRVRDVICHHKYNESMKLQKLLQGVKDQIQITQIDFTTHAMEFVYWRNARYVYEKMKGNMQ